MIPYVVESKNCYPVVLGNLIMPLWNIAVIRDIFDITNRDNVEVRATNGDIWRANCSYNDAIKILADAYGKSR
jgi:hypothetical protein